jgi:4-amino-4-deoxy-L-arabinose transferase-like glycosyltransferase
LLAVYPPNLTAPDFLMTETVFTFSLLLALYWFILAAETGRLKWFVLTGVALALGTYFRPTAGLLPVVFFVYLLYRGDGWRRVICGTGVMGLVLVLLLTPWMVRNYIQFKEFIPFTVSSGNPFLRGTYINGEIIIPKNDRSKRFPWVKNSHIRSDRAQTEFAKKRLSEGFRKDFWGYLRWYTIGKFADFWGKPYYYREITHLPARTVQIFHNFLLAAGIGGLVLGLFRKKPLVLFLLLVSAYFTALHMVYLTGPRYGFPTMQLLGILAAYGLVEGWQTLWQKYVRS